MSSIIKVVLSIYGLLIGVAVILVIFFLTKRIKAKKLENFEKRDN